VIEAVIQESDLAGVKAIKSANRRDILQ